MHITNDQLLIRQSKNISLKLVKALGLRPQIVIDVGAQKGTGELYDVFPECHHLLIEPVKEMEVYLAEICSKLPKANYFIGAASDVNGKGKLRLSSNFMCAGLQFDDSEPEIDGYIDREIDTFTIDTLLSSSNLYGETLIKIDVDGQELKVLEGAKETLKNSSYVVIESTVFGQINKVINFMLSNNFAIYDILELGYRPLDGALWQADIVFLPCNSPLLQNREFATAEILDVIRNAPR